MPTRHALIGIVLAAATLFVLAPVAEAAPAAGPASPPAAGPASPKAASAKKSAKAAPKVKEDPAITQAKVLLASSDKSQVETGIQSLGLIGKAEAVGPLADRIRSGLPPELIETAILTLMTLGEPSAGAVLSDLAAHRRPEVRLRAVEAISALKTAGAESELVAALSDSDERVRTAAATGLGEIGARGALETLFHALDRGNMAASQAIGKVVDPGQATRLLAYLGKIPFYSLGPALGEVIRRADVAEDAKLAIITGLQEAATPEVKGFLGDLMASGGEALGQNITRALLRAMQEIAD